MTNTNLPTVCHYSLNDFNEILFGESLQYTLDKSTEEIIENLANLLGIVNTNVITKPSVNNDIVNSHPKRSKSSFYRKDKEMEDSWLQPAFKPTKIEKKEGTMNEIRSCLNKLSQKNYDTNKTQLLELIRHSDSVNLPAIANNIFDIASTNKFYSEIYANLYKELLAEFEIFGEILKTFILAFTETMRDIHYVDPKINYDEFCAYNKKNDARKATCVFITNLCKKGVLPIQTLSDIILQIQTIMNNYMENADRSNEVEEITENLFLLTTMNAELKLATPEQWEIVLANITRISQCKAKDHVSLTSRTIFKHLDMLDSFEEEGKKEKKT